MQGFEGELRDVDKNDDESDSESDDDFDESQVSC